MDQSWYFLYIIHICTNFSLKSLFCISSRLRLNVFVFIYREITNRHNFATFYDLILCFIKIYYNCYYYSIRLLKKENWPNKKNRELKRFAKLCTWCVFNGYICYMLCIHIFLEHVRQQDLYICSIYLWFERFYTYIYFSKVSNLKIRSNLHKIWNTYEMVSFLSVTWNSII